MCVCACVRACVRVCLHDFANSYQCATSDSAHNSSFAIKHCRVFIFVVLSTVKIRKVFTYAVQTPLCNTDSNYSTPPKSPVVSGSSGTAQESTDSRPRPPSPPPHTSPITVGGAKPAAGSYSSPSTTHHSPQPPREDSVKCKTTICMCVCVCTVCTVCVCTCVC